MNHQKSLRTLLLIIPESQKTEFRNPRFNSRPLRPFNLSGFDKIRGVVKNNGSQEQVLLKTMGRTPCFEQRVASKL